MEPHVKMNFYTINDLQGLISLMSQDDIKQISQSDLLNQLDSLRELRSTTLFETPIQRKIDFTISSPEFTFKQPSNITGAAMADTFNTSKELKHRLSIKKKLENPGCTAKSPHVVPVTFNFESMKPSVDCSIDETQNSNQMESIFTTDVNPFKMNSTSGTNVKRGARPRRGATPHKSPPSRSGGRISTEFTSSFSAKENREPNSSSSVNEKSDFCFTPKQAGYGREGSTFVTVNSPGNANIVPPANISWPSSLSPQVDLDTTTPLNSIREMAFTAAAAAATSSVSGLPDLTSGIHGTGNRSGSETPQSVDSAMSLDSPREEKEPLKGSTGNAFKPQSLDFLFSSAPARLPDEAAEKNVPILTTGMFNMGISNATKKKEFPSPRGNQSDSTHIQWLDQTFASVTISEAATNLEGNSRQSVNEAKGNMSPFSSWWGSTDSAELSKQKGTAVFHSGEETVGGDVPHSSSGSSDSAAASSRSPFVAGETDSLKPQSETFFVPFTFKNDATPATRPIGPFTSAPVPFTFVPGAVKTARPPSPKTSPQSAYIRRSKAALSQSHRKSSIGSEQRKADGMDVADSPIPFLSPASPAPSPSPSLWGLRMRSASRSAVKAASIPRKTTPYKAVPSVFPVSGPAVAGPTVYDSSDSESSDCASNRTPTKKEKDREKEKESWVPTSILKPRTFHCDYTTMNKKDSQLAPDESAERMNELANSYRKQGAVRLFHFSAQCYLLDCSVQRSVDLIALTFSPPPCSCSLRRRSVLEGAVRAVSVLPDSLSCSYLPALCILSFNKASY